MLALAQKQHSPIVFNLDEERNPGIHSRRKWMSSQIPYYHNSVATFCVIISGDVEVNPDLPKITQTQQRLLPDVLNATSQLLQIIDDVYASRALIHPC